LFPAAASPLKIFSAELVPPVFTTLWPVSGGGAVPDGFGFASNTAATFDVF
jgi:hypothetical protein